MTDDDPDSPAIEITARAGRAHAAGLRDRLARCRIALLDAGEAVPDHVSVALVGDKVMSDLHARYSGDPAPTDVLTFELDRDNTRVRAGEVVVCVPQAKRTSADRGTDPADELLLYALHGLLHLCGYDDRTAADFRRMHRREDELLTAIGVGPVFERAVA